MLRIPKPLSEAEAKEAGRRPLWKSGDYDGEFLEAVEQVSRRGNDMIQVLVVVRNANGDQREFRDYLTAAGMGAAKLRAACVAIGALAQYEAGEISQDDFPGQPVKVRIGVKRERGYEAKNVIESYQSAASASVVNLRSAG